MVEPVYETIGRNVRTYRELLGITQHTLAKRIGMSRAGIATIETGRQRVRVHTMVNLAQALGVAPAQLMGDVEGRHIYVPGVAGCAICGKGVCHYNHDTLETTLRKKLEISEGKLQSLLEKLRALT